MARRQSGGNGDDDGTGGAPAWMVTYGDLMSLLLTFFVLLLSFSSVQEEAFEKAMASLKGALGVMKFDRMVIKLPKSVPDRGSPAQIVASRIARYIKVRGLSKRMKVQRVKGGFKITLEDPVLFQLGSAKLSSQAHEVLDDLAGLLMDLTDYSIEVEGHTDNVPVRAQTYPSNLELSVARALSVARYFIDRKGYDPRRIGVAGFGENRPVASNDTPEGRQKNRRVEINIIERNPIETGQDELVLPDVSR